MCSATDSEAATLITSTIDHRDHGFILGATNPHLQPLYDTILRNQSEPRPGGQHLFTSQKNVTSECTHLKFVKLNVLGEYT
jgi:isocitrate lyase